MARTTVDVGWRDWWRVNFKGALQYRGRADLEWSAGFERFTRNKQRGELSESEVAELTKFQVDTVTADFATRAKGGLTLSQQRFLSMIENLIAERGLRSAANIGARVDHFCARLAERFPAVEFYSIDFQPNLALHNSQLPQRPNWHFQTGYPLHLIRNGDISADIYFFVSTSVLMNNGELNLYFDAMSKHARALAFCEGWWPSTERLEFRICRPETIPKEEPYCGGDYSNYHHNYIAKLEDRGYHVKFCRVAPEGQRYHYLQIVAVKP
jgi:hypothetical protein